ncbi:MAG: MFS transporter, partial [Anaerolineae bacterium]|nr:MFS transporter [Anaerolineae bacterium]
MNIHRLTGLWRHPDFMKLWIGQTISEFGSRISRDGIPLTAVIVLAATPEQMGWLVALASAPVLLLSLMAGVWVDRLPRRPIMIAADVGRLLLLLTIPLAALTGTLTFGLLLAVTVGMSALSLFFNLAYRAILPGLVERPHILEANTKLSTTESLAEIGGPALSGVLIQALSAPLAIFFDAVSFLFSAVSVLLIRKPETHPVPVERGTVLRDIRAGLGVITEHPILRTMATGVLLKRFFGNFFGAL